MQHAVPIEFIMSRWGDEEFLVSDKVESIEEALNLTEIIRVHIAKETFTSDHGNMTITASLRVSLMTGDFIRTFDHCFKQ